MERRLEFDEWYEEILKVVSEGSICSEEEWNRRNISKYVLIDYYKKGFTAEKTVRHLFHIIMNAFKVQVNVDFNKKPIFTGDKVIVNSLEGPNGEEALVPESFIGLVELKEGEIYAYDNNYSIGLSNYEIRRCKIQLL